MQNIRGAKILIVDDDLPHMTALCDTLEDKGYETVGCSTGRSALAALRTTKFDLLLTDLMMPEVGGIELIQAARESDADLVCILMTGAGTVESAVSAMKAGALDYILKPCQLNVILPVLDRALTVRHLRMENAALEARVREDIIELEAANQELEAFSYSVSHDLRAPLRAVTGFSRILLKEAKSRLSEREQDLLAMICRGGEEMRIMIESLLKLSRLGRQSLSKVPMDIATLVSHLVAELSKELVSRQMEFRIGDLPECIGDADLLKHVFINLISNAIKFTRGKQDAVVEIGCLDQNGEKIYFVRDNGAGFDMQCIEKLFGAFQRLHTQDEFEGTGVGLSIVRHIVNRHGGRIWAEAEVNKGATFCFTLAGNSAHSSVPASA